MINNKL